MDPNLGFLEHGTGDGERYFCHSCHRVFGLGTVQNPQDFYCPHCQSTFLEEIGGSDQIAVRHRTHGQLTTDQARRITSATAMLRLLESQLREELETLQLAFAAASARMNEDGNRAKQKQLTKLMKSRLRGVGVNLDMACSQPSCPICSEDFVLGNEALRLPCSHIFHDACVMPWLEMKQNCPICRAELSDALPTEADLEPCSVIELKTRLRDFDVDDDKLVDAEKPELIKMLIEKYKEQQETDAKAAADAAAEASSSVSFPLILRAGGGPFGGGMTMSSASGGFPMLGLSLTSSGGFPERSTSGPSSLFLQRRTGRAEDDDDDDDDDDDQFNRIRFGLRYVPSR